jgi:hypothetical protein
MTDFGQRINVVDLPWSMHHVGDVLAEAPFICDNCHRLSIATAQTSSDPNNAPDDRFAWADDAESVTWIPRVGVGQEYADVPEHIAAAASEAHACQSIRAYRAAVMLARSVVEATAKAKGITDGSLQKKIEEMYRQNIISEHVKEQAHEVRYLGNDMAHGDFVEPIIAEDADEVLALMAAVLHAVFQSHARLKRVRDARIAKKSGQG